MWTKPPTISQAEEKLKNFRPPYCPNPGCTLHHLNAKIRFYHRFGSRVIQRFPYLVLRYRCKSCQRCFTSSFFELSYKDRLSISYERIFVLNQRGVSKRSIAELLRTNESSIRHKISKMTRFALLKHAKYLENLKICEPIVFDGIENFSYSQYDPNNIHHAVGQNSLFTYDFNFAPLNRKGRMSFRQKAKLRKIEAVHGRYPSNAIENKSREIFKRLLRRSSGELELISDNHYAYRRALQGERLHHIKVPSKIYRNYRNKLFAINHMDMLLRHNTAAFKRETIAFSKHSIAMQESFFLYMTYKNYLRPKFLKAHKRDPSTLYTSPAMHLGLTDKILRFREFFQERIVKTQVNLNKDWEMLFLRSDPFSRRVIKPYAGI